MHISLILLLSLFMGYWSMPFHASNLKFFREFCFPLLDMLTLKHHLQYYQGYLQKVGANFVVILTALKPNLCQRRHGP